jgi:S1-C subfamily serine protease
MASSSLWETLSNEISGAAEQVGRSVVAIHGRHRMMASGIQWRKGVIVTAEHAVRRADEVSVIVEPGKTVPASIAGRDASTDLAVLKIGDTQALSVPEFAESTKLGHLVLALGRSWRGNLVASSGIIGGLAGEWRTWRGGRVDQHLRLDLNLYPGFSGGPLVSAQGKVLGINSSGLGRGRAVTIPAATVNRVVDELLEKGHIARPYLGVAMQPVAIPESSRGKLKSETSNGLLVAHVEPGGPADKAGILLGDVLVELQGKPLEDTENIQDGLASFRIGDNVQATLLRAGSPLQVTITLEDRPTR